MYTQCPNCRTVFRTAPRELAAAQGQVRCGRCHHVFDARPRLYERLLDIPQAGGAAPAAPAEPVAVSKEATAEPPRPEPAAPAPAAPPETDAPTTTPIRINFDDIEVEDYPRIPDTEDEAAEPPSVPDETLLPSFAAEERAPTGEPPRPVTPSGGGAARPMHHDVDDEPVAGFTASRDFPEDFTFPLRDDAATASTEEVGTQPTTSAPERRLRKEQRQNLLTTAGWTLATLSLLALLIFQYAYFMRNDLARYPELRPWLEKMCVRLDCELPLMRDLSALELTYREIHSHPTARGALMINATFVNKAPFTQPYPVLQISLSDVAGRVMASRRLQPAEYLGEDVDVKKGIPSRTPVHVVLEVVDPGRDAVGFQFDFLQGG